MTSDEGSAPTDWTAVALRFLRDETPVPTALAFSPDGGLLAVGTRTGRIRLWDLQGRRLLQDWERTTGERTDIIGRAERHLANVDAMEALTYPTAFLHRLAIQAVAFSPTGVLLCTGSGSGSVDFWTLQGRHINSWGSRNPVRHVMFDDEGEIVTYVSDDALAARTVVTDSDAWSVPIDPPLRMLDAFAVKPDGQCVARVVGMDGEMVVHRRETGDLRLTWRDALSLYDYVQHGSDHRPQATTYGLFDERINALSWDLAGSTLAAVNSHEFVRTWRIGNDAQPDNLGWVGDEVRQIRVASLLPCTDGFLALASTDQGQMTLSNVTTGDVRDLEGTADQPNASITASAISSDGSRITAGLTTGEILLWDLEGRLDAHLRPQ
jgi:WD40 repeat protein